MNVEAIRSIGGENDLLQQDVLLPRIPLLGQVEIIGERDGGLVECYVPTELIDHEEVPVKEEWASSLAAQMKDIAAKEGGSGQQAAILLGYIDGESKFKIIDGFHRDAALVKNQESRIYATVKHTDWNSLFDSRIFTAKDHAHVRFSRVVQWIREVWEYSGLEDQLSVQQAILLYRYDNPGNKLGVDPNSVAAAKEWVRVKEHQWGMQAMTIHSHLSIAENVDPKLVHSTREKRSGHALEAPTQSILKVFSDLLPNDFDLQNLVMYTAMAHNLKTPQVTALAAKVKGLELSTATAELEKINWEEWEPAYSDTKNRQLRRAADPRYKGGLVLSDATKNIQRTIERVRLAIDREEEVTPAMRANLQEAITKTADLTADLGRLATELTILKNGLSVDEASEEVGVPPPAPKPQKPVLEPVRPQAKTIEDDELDDREPTSRKRWAAFNLPHFGELTKEDWAAIEPHHRLALAFDHEDITDEVFSSVGDVVRKAADIAQLVPGGNTSTLSKQEFIDLVKPLVDRLKYPKSREGNLIETNTTTNTVLLTTTGKQVLAKVVKKALLEVDDSREPRS